MPPLTLVDSGEEGNDPYVPPLKMEESDKEENGTDVPPNGD